MKITCQTCQSKYTVSDEKVQGKTVKIKCRKCGATILVNSSGATTSPAGSEPVSMSTSASELGVSFLVNVAEGDQRTMSLVEVVEAYNTSVVTAETYVWSDGMGDWQPLGQVESIVAALNSGAAAPAPVAAEPAYAPPAAAPYAAAPYAAAAAPVSQPVADPAPRAAARRDVGRRGPDLFGGGGGGVEEVATSAPAFNGRAPSPMASSGQREENSMLFSLSALTAKAPSTSSGSSSSSKTNAAGEDSGLIDLKALADNNSSSSGAANLVPDHAGLFPLGAPIAAAPLAAPSVAVMSVPPPAASKTPIFIGVGIAVAALAIVGTFFAMKGSAPPPVVATENTAPTAAPTPPPVVEPPPTATAVAAAPTASASAAVAAKGGAKGGGAKGGAAAGGTKAGGGTATPTPPTTAPPPVKKSSCGCAAGDLLCAMKCSAK